MKSKIIFILNIFLTTNLIVYGQLELVNVRDMAMGNASVASVPADGVPKNIAMIPNEPKSFVSCGISNNYFIKDLSPVFISYIKSFSGNLSIETAICRMGNNNFSEQFFEAGISKKLGQKFSAGIKIQYHQWILNESHYDNNNAFIPSLYLFTNPYKNLCIGVILRNPVRSRMNAFEQKKIPAGINPGISCKISEKLSVACSVMQQSDLPLTSQFGVEYFFHPLLSIRFGWRSLPVSETFGFALKMKRCNLDLGFQTHPVLGNTSSIALAFSL